MTALILNPTAKKKKKNLSCFVFISHCSSKLHKAGGKPTYQIFDSCTLLALLGISPLSLCSLCHYGLLSVYSRLWEAVKTWMFLHSTSTERANWSGLCGGEWQEEGNYAETVAVALSCWSVSVWAFFSFLSFLFFPGLKCAYSTAGFSHTAPLLDLKSPLIPATWCSLGTLWAPSAGSGRHLVVTLCACIQTGDEISRL